MEGRPEDFAFDHTGARSEKIPLNTFRDYNLRIEDPVVLDTASGGAAGTSFNTPTGAYGRPIDTLYDKSTRDGSAFDTKADVYSTDGRPIDTLPDTPLHNPSTEPGGNIGNLRDELAAAAAEAKAAAAAAEAEAKAKAKPAEAEAKAAEAEAAKIALVNEFYQSNAKKYGLPLPEKIPYDQFEVGEEEGIKTIYWTPKEGTKISIINRMGGGFLALSTLVSKYGKDGTEAIRTSMGLKDYNSKTRKLSPNTQKQVQQASDNLPAKDVEITPVVADQAAASTEKAAEALDEQLTPEQSAALGTIDDPPLDLQWVSQASRELRGLRSAMTRTRDELVNNLAKLSELDKHIALEESKLEVATDETTKNIIAERLRKLQDLRGARLEATSATREALRSQISRIRETLHRILHEDKTLAERIRTLFREQGITIASILTALGMTISTIVLALTGGSGGGAAPPQPPQPPGKGGAKEWIKKQLQSLGRILAKLAGKAAAALPGIIGSIVSWLLSLLRKTAVWLSSNLWAVLLAVGGLLLVAAREWLLPKKPKQS